MATANLAEMETRTVSVDRYIDELPQLSKQKFQERKQNYQPNREAIEKLKRHKENIVVTVFSAEWCKDCITNVPVLGLISEKTGIKIRVFGDLKSDPLSHKEKWRIPPSPHEVKTFRIEKTPTIIIFDTQGKQLGRIVEKPKPEKTLEEELLEIIQQT